MFYVTFSGGGGRNVVRRYEYWHDVKVRTHVKVRWMCVMDVDVQCLLALIYIH